MGSISQPENSRARVCSSVSLTPKDVFLTNARSKTSPSPEGALMCGGFLVSELLDS